MLLFALLIADPCEQAAGRYLECVREVLGGDAAEIAAAKRTDGVAECKRDAPTQAMYRECLPQQSCQGFLDCLTDFAERSAPPITGSVRQTQCAEHVRQGLRGIANGVMMMNDARDMASKRSAQSCILDDRKRVESCLKEGERSQLDALAKQRQKDCEA